MMVDFKRFLKFLTPKEQLYQITYWINDFNKSYFPCVEIKKKICMLKELRALKKMIRTKQQ